MSELSQTQSPHNPRMALVAGGASLVTVVFLIAIKLFAYLDNGGASVLASLIDSVVDGSVSLMTLMAIRISLKPADSEHRYGHGKVEGLAALFQAAFIVASGFFLFLECLRRFHRGQEIGDSTFTIGVMIVSIILSLLLTFVQKYTLRHAPSLAVEADHAHYSMDIVVNVGVILVVLAIGGGAPAWVDPLFGIFIAAYFTVMAKSIAARGVDMLLDRELPDNVREAIIAKVLAHPNVLGMHDLRTRKSGMRVFMSFDVELDPSFLLYHAHEIVRAVEHDLLIEFPNAEILIHADPHGDTHDTRHNVAGVHHE